MVLFVRAQILAAAVLLALPTVKSFTRGRPIRWWVTVACAMFFARAVLWLTTNLVLVHTTVNGEAAVRVTRGADISGACRSRRLVRGDHCGPNAPKRQSVRR